METTAVKKSPSLLRASLAGVNADGNYPCNFFLIMSFNLHQGDTETVYPDRAASTDFSVGDAVEINGSGYATPCDDSSTGVYGICYEEVDSSHPQYASNTPLAVRRPLEQNVRFRVPTTGGAVQGDVGVDVDLSDATTVDRSTTADGAVTVERVVDADEVIVSLN